METRQCKKCKEQKCLDEFTDSSKSRKLKDGTIKNVKYTINTCDSCRINVRYKRAVTLNDEISCDLKEGRTNDLNIIDGMREIYLSMGYKNIDEYRKERSLKELKKMYYDKTNKTSI